MKNNKLTVVLKAILESYEYKASQILVESDEREIRIQSDSNDKAFHSTNIIVLVEAFRLNCYLSIDGGIITLHIF